MKKQILILAFLLVAIFASVTKSYGQLLPRALSCTVSSDSPLNPSIGATYTYSVTVPNSGAFTGTTYEWFVTKDKSFVGATHIGTGTGYDAVVASGTFDNAANTIAAVNITWKSTATTTDPYFLVVNTVGANVLCSTANMKVYKIIPENKFTIDLANYDGITTNANLGFTAGLANPFSQCISNIVSATWVDTDAPHATYDYGTNTMIWEVIAANWTTSWTPTLSVSALAANETATITWATAAVGTGTTGTFTPNADSTIWTGSDVVSATTIGAAGHTIFIRMVLDHSTTKNFEGLVDEPITLAIDGTTANLDKDVHYSATIPEDNSLCGKNDGYTYDKATQTIKARPGINSTTYDAATVPVLQDLLIPKP